MAALTPQIVFSEYCVKLKGPERLRYEEKVKLCGFDPFVLKKSDFLEDTSLWLNSIKHLINIIIVIVIVNVTYMKFLGILRWRTKQCKQMFNQWF